MKQEAPGDSQPEASPDKFDAAEIGALAHLYRGEVYRSTIWRTRLDMTTNWSVVTLGVAMSISFSGPNASPLPLLLVGLLVAVFLVLESRRYRYFNVWRARARWLEKRFYAPLLHDGKAPFQREWRDTLANDYLAPQYHISLLQSTGRRLRRNYILIFAFQAVAFYGKIIIHPTPLATLNDFFERMAVGPIPGVIIFAIGIVFHGAWVALALVTRARDRAKHAGQKNVDAMG